MDLDDERKKFGLMFFPGLIKVTRPSFFFFFGGGGVPSYFEALWYPHLYFYYFTLLFASRVGLIIGLH